MQQNNFILDESVNDASCQLRLKLKYLQDDKDKLEVACQQMKENIKLLRTINKQISKTSQHFNSNQLITQMQQQNNILQTGYLRLLTQNNELKCKNLMLQQIVQEAQNEFKQILKGYESKIIELRRSIQFKQSCIQTFEQNINSTNSFQIGNIPPSNVSIVFFNQIDQYKNKLNILENQNGVLKKQNNTLKKKILQLESQMQSTNRLIMSRCGLYEIRSRINIQSDMNKRAFSQSKQLTQYQNNSQTLNKNSTNIKQQKSNIKTKTKQSTNVSSLHTHQTRQTSYQSTSSSMKINQIKQQLKKKNTQFIKLAQAYQKQKTKRKQLEQKAKTLIHSNKYYKQKRQTNYKELNYYKAATLDLFRILQKKKVKRSYSVDKQEVEKIISNIKLPQQTQALQNNKAYWKNIHQQLTSMLQNKNNMKFTIQHKSKLKRSHSSILDYTELYHQNDRMEKYLQNQIKNNQEKFNNKNVKNIKRLNGGNDRNSQLPGQRNKIEHNHDFLDDFSRILKVGANGQVFSDQTLIIKPKVMNYAERKLLKHRKLQIDPHNLTIITENIL